MTDPTDPWAEFNLTPAGAVPKAADPWGDFQLTPVKPAEGVMSKATLAPALPERLSDKYKQAAKDLYASDVANNLSIDEGYGRLAKRGATLNWSDDIAASLNAVPEMYRRGTNYNDARAYTKAYENLLTDKARAKPLAGLAEGIGTLTTGAGVAGPATRLASPGWNYLKNIGVGGSLGGLGGAGEAPTIAEVPENAWLGAALGVGIGAAAPALPVIARPFLGRFVAPEESAARTVADAARRAKVPTDRMVQELADAQAAGQPFTVADALGKEGQRALVPIAKTPGDRNTVTKELTERVRNRPGRIGEQFEEGLGVQGTAEQASKAALERGRAESKPYYASAMGKTTHSDYIQKLLNSDLPEINQGLRAGLHEQRIHAAAQGVHFNPLDHVLDAQGNLVGVPNTRTLQTLKIGLDRIVQSPDALNPATGELNRYGRSVDALRRGLVGEMGRVNSDYATANRIYGGEMQFRDAVKQGRDMATRGRYRDTIPAFQELATGPGLPPAAAQQGVRIGLADKVLEQAERGGGRYPSYLESGSPKGVNELAELSLYQGPNRPGAPDQLRRRLNREETMRETERAALGGSSTFENAADAGASAGGLPGAMGMATSAISGNPVGFVRGAAETAGHFLKGQTEAQREAIARALLTTDPTAGQALAARMADVEARRLRGLRGVFGPP